MIVPLLYSLFPVPRSLLAALCLCASVVEASRDLKSLEAFIPEFIEFAATQAESGLAARRRAQRLQVAVNPERLQALPSSLFPIPYAFELWIGHLSWLDQISAGIEFRPDDLRPEEAQGLAILRRARNKFWGEHAACPLCQAVNLRTASFCGGCGQEFGGNR